MRLSWKIFFSTFVLVAIAFALGGWALNSKSFQDSFERESSRACDENQLILYALGSAAGESCDNDHLENIASQLASSSAMTGWLRLTDEQGQTVYSDLPGDFDALEASDGMLTGRTVKDGEDIYIQVAAGAEIGGRAMRLETARDVTDIYDSLNESNSAFQVILLAVTFFSGVCAYFIARMTTGPVRRLTKAAGELEKGNYSVRAQVKSRDETGELARSFNSMADALESKILQLEKAGREREDFVASFAHELKTPLTSIIGYADTLRSRQMDEEERMLTANIIYNEGRRLEAMSLKLLELIVMHRTDFPLRRVDAKTLIKSAAQVAQGACEAEGIAVEVRAEPCAVMAEPDLVKTLIINLVDNARKASVKGQRIIISGQPEDGRYQVSVTDTGCGIPDGELERVTEPFYMVDKSRARAMNGAGLGLALCREIAEIHGGQLSIDSVLGEGTSIAFTLEKGGADDDAQGI